MARPLRIEYDGALYHITSRGNERKLIYRDDADRRAFLDILHEVNKRYNWLCHAYCLMDNHYHLVVETPAGNLSRGMRQLNGVYTQLFNKRHTRVGHLLQGRYKAILIEKESYLLEVCRYVVLNPVRAKAAGKPEDWTWSSYRAMAALEEPHLCLTTDWILGQFGSKRRQAATKYREFVAAGINEKGIWEKVKGQSILGDEDFVDRLHGYVKGQMDIKEIPKRQRYAGRPSLESLFEEEGTTGEKHRASAIKRAVMEHGYSLKEVGDFLGIHSSTVSRISRMENARNKT
jgi:REP element-mobilizing transposase RayT